MRSIRTLGPSSKRASVDFHLAGAFPRGLDGIPDHPIRAAAQIDHLTTTDALYLKDEIAAVQRSRTASTSTRAARAFGAHDAHASPKDAFSQISTTGSR